MGEDPAVRREDNLEQAFLTESIWPPVRVGLEAGAAGIAPAFDPPLVKRHPREEEAEKSFCEFLKVVTYFAEDFQLNITATLRNSGVSSCLHWKA